MKLLHQALATDPRFRKRFRAEAHSSAQLSHPHLMAVYDWNESGAGADPAPAYLVTELLTGGSLRAMLDAGHRLSLSQALVVGLHAADGLAYAHHNGFVHRDIKPANLLFGADGRLRIGDFGIARAIAEAAWTEPEGALVGTARYAAPEQATGGSVDGRVDVYGLAITLIEAVTGEVPLSASTPLATMVLRQDQDLPVPPAMGPLVPALEAAGRARVQDRCTAEEFANALRTAASGLPRPQKLPLPGLEHDPRAGAEPTARERPPVHDAETGVLVLGDDTTSIDLSSPGGEIARTRETPSSSAPRSEGPVADGGVVDDENLELEDNRRAWPFLLLLAVLGIGAFVAFQGRNGQEPSSSPTTVVPTILLVDDYVGLPSTEAIEAIEENGWSYLLTDGRADGSDPGEILEQSPAPGTELADGAEITLVVSEGQQLKGAPELVGVPLTEALNQLEMAGLFLGQTAEEYHETVPVDEVVRASVSAGDQVETGTAVDLVWSLGPAPREVPVLAGSPLADAQAALDELGLTYVVVEEYSQNVNEGLVISSDPTVGALIERGEQVTLVVSLGLPFVEVPTVVGLPAAEAADILTAAGLVVIDTVGPANGEVLATDPPAGESVRQGTQIIIFVRRG